MSRLFHQHVQLQLCTINQIADTLKALRLSSIIRFMEYSKEANVINCQFEMSIKKVNCEEVYLLKLLMFIL